MAYSIAKKQAALAGKALSITTPKPRNIPLNPPVLTTSLNFFIFSLIVNPRAASCDRFSQELLFLMVSKFLNCS